MSDPFEHLSEREILIRLFDAVMGDNGVQSRTKKNSEDIEDLKKWRFGLAGAWAALTALFGYKHLHG